MNIPKHVAIVTLGITAFACIGFGDLNRRPPDRLGMVAAGETYFPLPENTREIPVPGGDFETTARMPTGWAAENPDTAVIRDDDAPRGDRYLRMPSQEAATAISPALPIPGNKPLLISFWWSAQSDIVIYLHNNIEEIDPRINYSGKEWYTLPNTGGKWRRVGVFARAPAKASVLTVQFRCRHSRPAPAVALDDVRLRTATERELAAAWEARDSRFPPYPIPPRPNDGSNLALSISKLQGKGISGQPFVIWALGSSFTNFLGNGEDLRQEILPRFPDAPPIIYRKHVGSGTPYEFVRGWVRQFAVREYPDLILIYTNGKPEGLEQALRTIRQSCTADVIVPSLHFWARAKNNWRATADTPSWGRIRDICRKYDVEFVENRRELADWFELAERNPTDILGDSVHQNELGRRLINLNIARHFAIPRNVGYNPADRERRIRAAWALREASSLIQTTGKWEIDQHGLLRSSQQGARLTVTYRGNRFDILGQRIRGGGTARVSIDGVPAREYPAFAATYIRPDEKNHTTGGAMPGDSAPHAITLGKDPTPQSWTIRMLDNQGAFQLTGSRTGPDGQGNNRQPFVGNTGQIVINPELWRNPGGNRKGDTFTFEVYRTTNENVNFEGADGTRLHQILAHSVPNQSHTIEIEAQGDGPVVIDSITAYTPPGTPDPEKPKRE